MARLAAIEQGLYYPTDVDVLQKFVEEHVNVIGGSIQIFDPCVGEGKALAVFSNGIKDGKSYRTVKTLGIEIEENRASEAKKVIDTVHVGAFENFSFINSVDIIFANPPYDQIRGKRVELDWINKIAPLMSDNTRLVLVLPDRFFEGGENHNDMRMCLYQNRLVPAGKSSGYCSDEDRLGALRFPDPVFQTFRQCIFVVEKTSYSAHIMPKLPIAGVVGVVKNHRWDLGHKEYGYSSNRYSSYSEEKNKDFQAIREADGAIVESIFTDDKKITELFGLPKPIIPITPLMDMRDEILAAVIAGGLFSGLQIGNVIIRGGSQTIEDVQTRESEDGTSKDEIVTQRLVAHIAELSLETGDIESYTSEMEAFGVKIEEIAKRVKVMMSELRPSIYKHETDYDRLHKKFIEVRAPKIKRDGTDDLLAPQKQAAATILRGWETTKSIFLMGEMGVGKTITGLAAAVGQVLHRGNKQKQKIVLLIPSKNDLVKKWKEEISCACRDIPHTVVDVETITQVQEAFATEGLTFIVVKESMVKRTSGVETINFVKRCFNCGSTVGLVNAQGEIPEKDNEILYCAEPKCKVKYETTVRDRNKNAYSSLARYINDHYAKSYVLVIDEAHQMKGGDSARGYASGSLIRGANRVLMMTGTFYNGYASSMYFNLFRCSGSFRDGNSYDGVMDFVRLYGLEEIINRTNRENTSRSWSGYGIKKSTKSKEIPGIHPSMIGLMLPFTVFMKLSDMNTVLPAQREHTVFVPMNDLPDTQIDTYLRKVKDKALTLMRDRETKQEGISLMGQYTWAKSGCYDMYPMGDYVGEAAKGTHFMLDAVEKTKLAPKEEALLRIAGNCKEQGFPLLVYYTQTDRRPIQERLTGLFAKQGMKLVYMPSTVKDRIDFINKSLNEGADAVITNANLVREGIDLLMFRAIAWYGTTSDAILVNQANARIHRIGKQHETDVYYLGYDKTFQALAWTQTSKKVQAMQAMHGDVRAGLAALLGEKSMINDIQDSMIAYDHFESDLTVDDFPPLKEFAKVDIIKHEILVKVKAALTDTITLEEWKKIHALEIEKGKTAPRKKVTGPLTAVPQLNMF